MKAKELLQPGESAIAVYTDGKHFEMKPDRSGSTGYWKIDPTRKLDRVIIYERNPSTGENTIYLADHNGVGPKDENGRCDIYLQDIEEVGSTNHNWTDFADAGQNPIRYIEA